MQLNHSPHIFGYEYCTMSQQEATSKISFKAGSLQRKCQAIRQQYYLFDKDMKDK